MKTQLTERSECKLQSELDPAPFTYSEGLNDNKLDARNTKKVLGLIRALTYVTNVP